MSRTLPLATVFAFATGAVATGCLTAPAERDIAEVAKRYAFQNQTECSSWLRSYRTGYEYCASPPLTVDLAVGGGGNAGSVLGGGNGKTDKDSLLAHGEAVYGEVCVACHQANGEGTPGSFPPLAGAGDFYGSAQNQADIIVNGLSGEITVNGQTFNSVMAPGGGADLDDYDVAAVASYVRNSWGNDDGIVLPEDVAAVR